MDISSICAGIVTYNSNIKLLDRVIMAVSQQVDKVLVFDNSSRNIKDIVELCEKYDCKLHKSTISFMLREELSKTRTLSTC